MQNTVTAAGHRRAGFCRLLWKAGAGFLPPSVVGGRRLYLRIEIRQLFPVPIL